MAAETQSQVERAGIVLGVGLGGFIDGIVLHQILQWHHMVTSAGFPPNSVANLQVNTFWDGVFHAATWVLTVVGLALLWRAVRGRSAAVPGRVLFGALSAGWGLFNLVEGVVDHHLLGLHHVRPGPNELFWDLAFLAWGAALLLAGLGLMRQGRRAVYAKSSEAGQPN